MDLSYNKRLWVALRQLYQDTIPLAKKESEEIGNRFHKDREYTLYPDYTKMTLYRTTPKLPPRKEIWDIVARHFPSQPFEKIYVNMDDTIEIQEDIGTMICDTREFFGVSAPAVRCDPHISVSLVSQYKLINLLKGKWSLLPFVLPSKLKEGFNALLSPFSYVHIYNKNNDLLFEYGLFTKYVAPGEEKKVRYEDFNKNKDMVKYIVGTLGRCNVTISDVLIISSIKMKKVGAGFLQPSKANNGEYTLLYIRPEVYDPYDGVKGDWTREGGPSVTNYL